MAMSVVPALAVASLPPPTIARFHQSKLGSRTRHSSRMEFALPLGQSRKGFIARAKDEDFLEESAFPTASEKKSGWNRWMWLGVATAMSGCLLIGYIAAKRVMAADVSRSTQISHSGSGFHFTANVLGRKVFLGERTPGWIYFLLLMAAGFGLFVSEEALSVWVGATLARSLTWNSTREIFWSSLSQNSSYILSTILWVYWGVCLSDMIPFYLGKIAAQSGPGNDIRNSIGISKEKLDEISKTVQRYGNLIGFIERFSIGARNPTSFLAGASGIDPSIYFAGVCAGGIFTLPIQLSVGFVLRERPVAALAGVAAFVGIWTILPYAMAALVSFLYMTRKQQQQPQ